MKIGDRVEIKRKDIFYLKHRFRKGKVFGKITDIDGAYISVRPMWCKWEAELYPEEINNARN